LVVYCQDNSKKAIAINTKRSLPYKKRSPSQKTIALNKKRSPI
jgi:hypothetical protein